MDRWWWKMWKRYMCYICVIYVLWDVMGKPQASHPSIHAMDCIISHRSPASTRPRDTGLKLLSSTGSFGSVGFNRSCAWPMTFAEPPTSTFTPQLQTTPRCVPFWKIDVLICFIYCTCYLLLFIVQQFENVFLSLSIDRHLSTHVNTKTCSFMFHFRRISSLSLQTTTM